MSTGREVIPARVQHRPALIAAEAIFVGIQQTRDLHNIASCRLPTHEASWLRHGTPALDQQELIKGLWESNAASRQSATANAFDSKSTRCREQVELVIYDL